MRFWESYRGSSFVELLAAEHPQLLPQAPPPGFAPAQISPGAAPAAAHATTCVALTYEGGALVAADRLATMGFQVASREMEKVIATDAYSLLAIAGAAGPAVDMARLVGVQFEHREKIEGEALELEGKANTLAQLVRQNLPAAMQGLAVVPLFAGFDLRRGRGRVWRFEITGGRFEESEFEGIGSGAVFAREFLKKSYRANAAREQAIAAAVGAIAAAADEDRATGGVDLHRKIYPCVKSCGARGVETIADAEIAAAYDAFLQNSRRRGE